MTAFALDDAFSDNTTVSVPTEREPDESSAEAPVEEKDDAPPVEETASTDDGESEDEPEAEPGSRAAPFPIGSEVTGREWTIVINDVALGATDAVLAENMFNEPPDDGYEYILVNATVTYTGRESDSAYSADIEYVTADGVTIDEFDAFAVTPDALDWFTELYNDGSVTGNLAFHVPSESAADGTLAVTPGFWADTVFVSVR
ncbi:DUF4352 domain-containing protein [Microbacterium karelineae]|uniref:DUF4352 domain-containing protein n=1 Tax=Microbacterium karelineae TaxID=2654283 RepID=UPI003F67D49F